MIGEMFLPSERLGAEGAAMRRFARVLPHVVGEVLLARERLRAERALVRRLARVLPDMVYCTMLLNIIIILTIKDHNFETIVKVLYDKVFDQYSKR